MRKRTVSCLFYASVSLLNYETFYGNTRDSILQKNTFKSPNQASVCPKVSEPWTGPAPCARISRRSGSQGQASGRSSRRACLSSTCGPSGPRRSSHSTHGPRQSVQPTHLPPSAGRSPPHPLHPMQKDSHSVVSRWPRPPPAHHSHPEHRSSCVHSHTWSLGLEQDCMAR